MNDRTRADVADHLRRVAEDSERLGEELAHSPVSSRYEAVLELAVQRVPSARTASITTVEHGRFVTVAATDDRARHADAIQYELGSGPCVDAIVDRALYQPQDLAADDRWPEYGSRVVAELGLRSMLSYRMRLESSGVIAGLNLYADAVGAFDDHDLAEGLLLTTHAAQAVSTALLVDQTTNLQRALVTNRDIATAVGVLMGQHRLTRAQSFDLLRIASQNTNRKLHEVALDVIDTGVIDVTPHSRG